MKSEELITGVIQSNNKPVLFTVPKGKYEFTFLTDMKEPQHCTLSALPNSRKKCCGELNLCLTRIIILMNYCI